MTTGYTIEALEEQLKLIQELKLQILQGGLPAIQRPSSWRVGEVQFSVGGQGSTYIGLKDLLKMEKDIMEMMKTMFPTEHVVTHHDGIDSFGQDMTTYQNEESP